VQQPLITIITPVYNSIGCLERTLQSVINQTYKNIEFIVVDGASNDGSIEVINNYKDKITIFLSEPDKGAYDAINKGFKLAKGEWVNVMNAGDYFINEKIIENMIQFLSSDVDLIYGDTENRILNNKVVSALPINQLGEYWKKCRICAQSLFIRTNIAQKYLFDLRYPIQSYYDFMLKCIRDGYRFYKVDFVVASYMGGGMSDTKPVRETISRWKISLNYYGHFIVHSHFIFRVIRTWLSYYFLKFQK
jgi:glycosyltransferase involved in cell wall biosynthesis